MDLGRLGVWSVEIRNVEDLAVRESATMLEELGYGTIWYSAGSGNRGFEIGRQLLEHTSKIAVATGITSIWSTTADEAAAGFAELDQAHPDRFLLGLGVSHAPFVDKSEPGRYRRPLEHMARYLDELDAVPVENRILAALGDKMLQLARDRTAGTHPYLVTPDITAAIRMKIGPDSVVAVEQGVVLESDPDRARALARASLSRYLRFPNYVNNWLRAGYSQEDVSSGGSDRLIDDLIVWGDTSRIGERIDAHYASGADHVCVQVFGDDTLPVAAWEKIAHECSSP